MIRSSALFLAIIISLFIIVICGTVIVTGFIYNMQNKQAERRNLLRENLLSGIEVLLDRDFKADTSMRLSLYGAGSDSVLLEKRPWGVFQLGLIKTWIKQDTLAKAFAIGFSEKDSSKVLFLADENRPLTLSGNTRIAGTAFVPKSGIRGGYLDTASYKQKVLVYGLIRDSKINLPEPDSILLDRIKDLAKGIESPGDSGLKSDSVSNSFFNPVQYIYLDKKGSDISGKTVYGNVVISSDTTIIIDQYTRLNGAIITAPCVRIGENFKGNIQVFATDSVIVARRVKLGYPSAVLLVERDKSKFQSKIIVGDNCKIDGQLVAYHKEEQVLKPLIRLGANTVVNGEVYAKGYVIPEKGVAINGWLSAIRFIVKTSSSLYENYLLDVSIDRPALSKWYLSSRLFNADAERGKILCWLK